MKQCNSTGVKRKTNLTRSNFSSPKRSAVYYTAAAPLYVYRGESIADMSRRVCTGRLGKSAGKVFYPTPVCRRACPLATRILSPSVIIAPSDFLSVCRPRELLPPPPRRCRVLQRSTAIK